jgi:penicillin-binding protein 1C
MPKIASYKTRRTNFKTKHIFRKCLVILFALLLAAFATGIIIFVYLAKDLPNLENLAQRQMIESTKIYDRTGTIVLYDVHGEEKRTVIPFGEIPQFVKDATIVAEDINFYRHFGLDFRGIVRALLADLKGKRISQGGSTITQQFIKNSLLTSERTFARKVKEAILSIEMEIKYSKDEILNLYLNQVPYGSSAYGIEAAAQTFFNKKAKDLTLAESTALAALTKATTYYSPYGSHQEELKARQKYILDRMLKYGYITEKQLISAKEEKLIFIAPHSNIKAPHFVMYVKEFLEDKYGRDYIETAGLKVYTTLDWDLQQIAEKAIKEGAEKNGKKFNAQNAALVAIDPRTGQILAMVGSKNYWAEPYPKNCIPGKSCLFEGNANVIIRPRQPGSSFKPFAYARAFQKGFTPDTMLFDLEIEFNPNCTADASQNKDQYGLDCYHPKNYDGKFRGPVSVRSALAQSLNIPSVQILYLAGVDETINLAQDMGINTLKDRSRYGLSLVLGGGEVKLLEETAAFGVFATEGVKHSLSSIIKVENSKGDIVETYQDDSRQILEPQIARLISNILSDNAARSPMFGPKSSLYIEGIPAAAKTGTTQEYRDGWTIGYTPSLVAGVWTGNNDNTPINKEPGAVIAAPIWNGFIKNAYNKKQELRTTDKPSNYFDLPQIPESFTEPNPIPANKGILNGQYIQEIKVEANGEEKIYPEIHCILYYANKDNPQESGDGKNDPQFPNWENAVLNWVSKLDNGYLFNQNIYSP